MIRIREARAAIARDSLAHPLGFKGARMSAIWQAVAGLWAETGDVEGRLPVDRRDIQDGDAGVGVHYRGEQV